MRPPEEGHDPHGQSGQPAGPAAAGDPPPPPVAKASSGEVPPTASPAGGAPGQDDQAAAVEQDLAALLADAEAKRDEYLDLARRTQADFENYRKRMAAEVQAAAGRGKAGVAREVIEAVDNLERALEAGAEDGDLAGGVRMVLEGLRETLKRNGIEPVDPAGEKFDPTVHEALSTAPAGDGVEPGHVVQVVQKGYRMGEQLIRPARVVVSS